MAKPKKYPKSRSNHDLRVQAAIERAKRKGERFLHLDKMGLTEVPAAVYGMSHLFGINLANNRLKSLPRRLVEIPRLQWITLVGNPIEELPKGLPLVIDASLYRRLSRQIHGHDTTVFASLDIDPESADFLINRLQGDDGPNGIIVGEWQVTPTEHRAPPSGCVQKIIDAIAQFQSLEKLTLSGMALNEVPAGIRNLKQLESLTFAELNLTNLPEWLGEMPRLQCLQLWDTPVTSPPAEVVTKGLKAIKDYWRQTAAAGIDYLCEAKLIILGEPGAGKTSLANKIKDADYKLVPDQKSTEGIEVIRHRFPVALQVADNDGAKKTLHRDFQASMWDFGGQEIYHATHQFFLTRRSVYVLVCDDRKEDTDFSYWLQAVELLSDGSPLLIVQNEKQGRKRDINLASLRARFAQLRGALAVNLETNAGLAQAVQAIEKELHSLPHIGTGLPATWKRVREALEKDTRDYITEKEFLDICGANGFTREDDKRQLSGYLHDLGICLHFQDDPLLKKTVVLKPSWGTDAVYRVLDAPEILKARGHFTKAQLKDVWSEAKYAGMHDELLQLMMRFQLCYALEGGKGFIAPQMLSPDPPTYAWDATENVVVRYEYAFMPKGIITRFIVALHQRIAGGDKVWKTGVVLERDGSQAEVIEDYSQRRITVRVNGAAFQGLLAIIDEQMERLHASFPRLQCERYLPCPCEECRAKTSPEGFELGKLLNMAKKGRDIQCHASGEMVDAAALVRNILPGALAAMEREGLKASLGAMGMECDPSLKLSSPPVPLPTPPVREVYVSYAWTKESREIRDKLREALEKKGIKLIYDEGELKYKDSILDFMKRLGEGKAVVAVISQRYLQSENCMFEMLEIAKAQQFKERIFPVILPDANFFKAAGRAGYVRHWEKEIQDLRTAMEGLGHENLEHLQKDMTLYTDIRRLFDHLTGLLKDMNALSLEQHLGSDFDQLIQRVEEQLEA